MSRRRVVGPGVLLLALAGSPAPAQQLDGQGIAGLEVRTMRFDGLPLLKRLRQTVTPVGIVIPAGRFGFDIGTAWVSTRMDRHDGTHHTVSAFTDAQARATLVLGRDAVVATVMVNLPTGLENATPKDFTVIGAVSPGLLGFPVASYASGFSVTTGLAGAVQSGGWSLGAAGSLRMSSEFTPYADLNGPISYKSGLEGRIRAGADGIIGQSRLSLGVTFSTFGDDQFGQGGVLRGAYRPGSRWLSEATLIAPVGSSTLTMAAWGFLRSSGDTTGASVQNKEKLAGSEIALSIPIASWLDLEPQLAGRASFPDRGSAYVLGGGAGLRARLTDALSFSPALRLDVGRIRDDAGHEVELGGFYFSAFLRLTP